MRALIFVLILFLKSSVLANDDINFSFNKENAKYWQYISDRTMGGVSNGQAVLEQSEENFFARLTGNVSTKNNGGFIQLRSTLSFMDLNNLKSKLRGVRINVRGNGEIYHIFIRTSETRSYRDFFLATFVAEETWKTIDLPFEKFKHRFNNKILDGNDIRTFAIVAYGRDFFSDVSISNIIFYF